MSKKDDAKLGKLEEDALWRETCDLAEYMYSRLVLLPADEKWATERKLRYGANDLLNTVGQAVGNPNPIGGEYDWENARKYASGLKTMYRFAGRQKFIELEPTVMVRLDKLITQIDARIRNAKKQSEAEGIKADAERQKDIAAWREKHKLWKEMNS